MYRTFKGTLQEITPTSLTLDVAGVGYLIYIPPNILREIPEIGQSLFLHVSFVVRELSQTLYGFIDKEERDRFELLLAINGIGPKIALSIIGHLPKEQFSQALIQEDIERIIKVPGLGKKGAERLLVELRGKVRSVEKFSKGSPLLQDGVSALMHLGYSEKMAIKACELALKENKGEDLPSLIASALSSLS